VKRGHDSFTGSIEEEVFTTRSVTDVVRRTVERVLTTVGAGEAEMPLLIEEAVKGAVEGGVEVGAEPAETVKGIMIGVLQAVRAAEAEDAIRTVARAVREEARGHAWDLAEARRGLVAGAVEAGPDAGIGLERAAKLVHESMPSE
jgi:hypothetical protein